MILLSLYIFTFSKKPPFILATIAWNGTKNIIIKTINKPGQPNRITKIAIAATKVKGATKAYNKKFNFV